MGREQFARPVKERSTLTLLSARAPAMLAAAASSDISPSSRRTTTTSLKPARVSRAMSSVPMAVPFLRTISPWRTVWTLIPPNASAILTAPNFMRANHRRRNSKLRLRRWQIHTRYFVFAFLSWIRPSTAHAPSSKAQGGTPANESKLSSTFCVGYICHFKPC